MRKLLLLITDAMIVGGLYWFAVQLLLADVIHFRFVIGAVILLVTLGAYLLWVDFLAPMLRNKQ
jgi:hypothetical protein